MHRSNLWLYLQTHASNLRSGENWHWSTNTSNFPVNVGARDDSGDAQKLSLPDIPSIAVLPFDNLSNDPDQEFFADGMAEDLMTDLSKVSGLFVVARNSTFAYKGKTMDIRTIASELGVRYMLEGSIRKAGERVRINAQLIDATTGTHLWADRYDGRVDKVFELQDEVSARVVSALSVKLTHTESSNLQRVHTKNLEAYELFVRARSTPYPPIPERIKSALKMFEKVIESDPEFAGGYAGVSSMLSFTAIWGHMDPSAAIARAEKMANMAIAVDETFAWSYTALAMVFSLKKQHEKAVATAKEAIKLQPNDADAHAFLGLMLGLSGQYTNAINYINQAIRLNPQFFNGPYLNIRGQTQMLAGDYKEAIETFQENIRRQGPVGPPALCWGAASHAGLGNLDEANRLSGILGSDFPLFKSGDWNYPLLIRDEKTRDHMLNLMHEAGVPE